MALGALVEALDEVLELTGVARVSARAVGLGTPGPGSRRCDLLEGRPTSRSWPGTDSHSGQRSSVAWAFP